MVWTKAISSNWHTKRRVSLVRWTDLAEDQEATKWHSHACRPFYNISRTCICVRCTAISGRVLSQIDEKLTVASKCICVFQDGRGRRSFVTSLLEFRHWRLDREKRQLPWTGEDLAARRRCYEAIRSILFEIRSIYDGVWRTRTVTHLSLSLTSSIA